MDLTPGSIPAVTGRPGDCFRRSFCCVTGIDIFRVEHIETDQTWAGFFIDWEAQAHKLGWRMRVWRDGSFKPLAQYWIAVVPSLMNRNPDNAHAIVMKDFSLHYDPNTKKPRKRRPTKLFAAVELREVI